MTSSPEHGVTYQPSDYIGVWRRVAIDLVDVFVAFAISLAATIVLSLIISNDDRLLLATLVAWVAVWFGYFVLLKRSSFRTLGYILGRARIVNLQGTTPSIASLFLRLLFAMLGPLNFLFDLFWIPSDPCRQALRDKFAHTYVIRRFASPSGTGRIGYIPYTILGGSFIFQEVRQSQHVEPPVAVTPS
jgi:uncharacterized RDD family membrane protein YckC